MRNSNERISVTAQLLYDNPDIQGYIYLENYDALGLDPWVTINGVDALCDGSKIILEFDSYGEKEVSPDFAVYISEKSLKEIA